MPQQPSEPLKSGMTPQPDLTKARELEPCPFCGSEDIVRHPDFGAVMLCERCEAQGPRISFGQPNTPEECWNARILSTLPQSIERSEAMIDRLAYRVANAKIGETASEPMRCEGPTEFEINQARQWVRRVTRAMCSAQGEGNE